MAFKIFSDVRETSITGGTGNQVLAGVFDASYFAFGSAGRYANTDTFFYCMRQGVLREIGFGTYNSGANSISRTQVYKSTNANALVNFTNGQTIDIFTTLIAPQDLDAAGLALLLSICVPAGLAKSAAYTVINSDYGRYISLTGTNTLSYTAAATLGDGFEFEVGNDGTGLWTHDPNGAETFEGFTSFIQYPGERWRVRCDGTKFIIVTGLQTKVLLDTQTASASAQLDFTRTNSNRFVSYEFIIDRLNVATNTAALHALTSDDGGSNYQTTSYQWQQIGGSATVAFASSSSNDSKILIAISILNNDSLTSEIKWTPGAAGAQLLACTYWKDSTSSLNTSQLGANQFGTSSNAIRFKASTGNITSGTIRMYGVRK